MINALVVAAIILQFVGYDIVLRLGRALRPSRAGQLTERIEKLAVGKIFTLLRTFCGFDLGFEDSSGSPLPGRFLLVANHQSLLDIPVAMALMPGHRLRFVAKKELGVGIPLVSAMLRNEGHALVRRKGDAAQAMATLARFARRCRRDGSCPVVFPEGTRSRDGEVGTFHTAGVRRVLGEEALPIVVAVMDGGWQVAKIGDIVRRMDGVRCRMRILATLPAPKGRKEVLAAMEEARALVVAALGSMRAGGGSAPVH